MSRTLIVTALFAFCVCVPARSQELAPAWAYPVNPPGLKLPPDDGTPRRVPDSNVTYTLTQVRDRFLTPDWHPGDHPLMPEIVAQGRKPEVFACGFCHRAGGTGGPENANIAGLPGPYIVQQIADFKSGARKSPVAKRGPTELKAQLVKTITDQEVEAAAAYFSSLKPISIVKVIETDVVPKTVVTGAHLAAAAGDEKEPIDARIIEVPEDLEQFVSRDARARFVAYVPIGSIQKGQALAATGGGGKTAPCGVCHGPELKGLGPIPGIAGKSPSYLIRQLYDFKHDHRTGLASALMKPSVEKLGIEDMVVLAAYAASLAP